MQTKQYKGISIPFHVFPSFSLEQKQNKPNEREREQKKSRTDFTKLNYILILGWKRFSDENRLWTRKFVVKTSKRFATVLFERFFRMATKNKTRKKSGKKAKECGRIEWKRLQRRMENKR